MERTHVKMKNRKYEIIHTQQLDSRHQRLACEEHSLGLGKEAVVGKVILI